jgi:hypothetical protein
MEILDQTQTPAPVATTGDTPNVPDQYDADLDIMEVGKTVKALEDAVGGLVELARDGYNDFSDCLSNDGPANLTATRAALRLCRAALEEIETLANDEAARAMHLHHDNAAAWQAVGVMPSATA